MTEELRSTADRWRDVLQMPDDELARLIEHDQIDILVDLSGHSKGNRLSIFARKPAPIQVTAWGHATGTGLPTIDYLFADPIACPQVARPLFAEKIFDLPCNSTIEPLVPTPVPTVPPMLSRGFITFGVFNRASKVTDEAIALWARILRALPNARIVFKHGGFDVAEARSALLAKFAVHGIASGCLQFRGGSSRDKHLSEFRDIDISLDPFPTNGGVSTWESLQMGVPVVAKLGNSIASRSGGSIVSAVGLGEWVAEDDDGYFTIATKFASMPRYLEALRRELPARVANSEAGNNMKYTRAVEQAYREMWISYCRT